MLSRLVITFLPRIKHLLISRLQSPSAVILELKKIKLATVSTVSPSICHEVMGPDSMILVFWMLSFKPTFSLSLKKEKLSLVNGFFQFYLLGKNRILLFQTEWGRTCLAKREALPSWPKGCVWWQGWGPLKEAVRVVVRQLEFHLCYAPSRQKGEIDFISWMMGT